MSCQGRWSVSNGTRTRFVAHRSCKRRDKRDCWLVFFKEVEYVYLFFFLPFFLSFKYNNRYLFLSLLKIYFVLIYSHDTWIYIDEIVLKIFVDEFQLCIYSWNSFFFFFKYFSPCLFVNLHVSSRDYPVLRCKQLIKNDNGNHRAERDFPFDRYDRTCSKTRFACNRVVIVGKLNEFFFLFFFFPTTSI